MERLMIVVALWFVGCIILSLIDFALTKLLKASHNAKLTTSGKVDEVKEGVIVFCDLLLIGAAFVTLINVVLC